ncbi:DUF58 domain-containing protein [Zooshikella sp. RANM57]|uniref:DUF58 domain-containing protein n=1 Tax=Zooshikella sp. RANM57 TaxID=3425863 RepID=UPI003D6E7DC4
MTPSKHLLLISGGITVVTCLIFMGNLFGYNLNVLAAYGHYIFAAIVILLLIDSLTLIKSPILQIEREAPVSMSLGEWHKIKLTLSNREDSLRQLSVIDGYPQGHDVKDLPQAITIPPSKRLVIHYELRPLHRGEYSFAPSYIKAFSLMGLWQRQFRIGPTTKTRVYPNFATISHYLLLATDNHVSQMGIRQKPRRGEGLEFHQLREYREGDSMRQIDWKSSARKRKLISREYQDERDQQIIFMLDCGQRMRTQDGDLSHFDHCLNAMLLLAYVALKQGDAVGLITFSGQHRWYPPTKGLHTINQLLNQIYDLQATTQASDYSSAAKHLMQYQPKRSLIITLSNVRDENADDLIPALKLLRRRHLVLLANLREHILDSLHIQPIEDFNGALNHAASEVYLKQRKALHNQLISQSIFTLDSLPEKLPPAIVNRYLDIKRSNQL